MPSDMLSEWKAAKKEFEDVTNKKRPKKTFLGVFKLGAGIEPALKKCDAIANEKTKKDSAARLKAAAETLKSKVDDYVDLLNKEIAKEDKENQSAMLKALQALKARAKKFEPHFKVSIVEHEKLAANDLLGLASAMADPLLLKTIANATAAIKRIIAKPTVEVYDKEMANSKGEAGRKVATALQGVINKGGDPGFDAPGYLKKLLPFSNPTGEHKMTMSVNSSKEEVLANITEFAKLINKIKNDVKK